MTMKCGDDNYHALIVAWDKHQTPTLRVPRVALNAVLECHGETPIGLIDVEPREGSTTVQVRRDALDQLLKQHHCDQQS